MLRRLSFALALWLPGCVNHQYHEAQHAARVEQIEVEFSDLQEQFDQETEQALREAESFRKYLIQVEPGSPYKALEPITPQYEAAFKDCGEDAECRAKVGLLWNQRLLSRYFKADIKWVEERLAIANLEPLFVYSHNAEVLKEIAKWRREAMALKEQTTLDLKRLRAHKMQLSKDSLALDIEEEERRTRAGFAAAIAAGGQSFAQGMQPSREKPRARYELELGCTSDIGCGISQQCLKNNFSSSGRCVQRVTSHGLPVMQPPRVDSLGPKMPSSSDCRGPADCPVGFQCDINSGACLR